jgi:DNA-directed RNA polymerase specialized sigma24 family protein
VKVRVRKVVSCCLPFWCQKFSRGFRKISRFIAAPPSSGNAPDPWAAAQEPGIDTVGTLDAREALRALARLPKRYRDVLAAFARGEFIRDFAREQGIGEGKAWSRLRRARAAFLKLLAGRGWRKP